MERPDATKDPNLTTLTGEPLRTNVEPFTSMNVGDVGFVGDAGSSANLGPVGYTDDSVIRVPINFAEIGLEEQEDETTSKGKSKGSSFFRKVSQKLSRGSEADAFTLVPMKRRDYLKYWIKGRDGNYLPSTEEPEGGRAEWVQKQLRLSEQGMV